MKKAKLFLGLLILVVWSCGSSSSSSKSDNDPEEATNEMRSEAQEQEQEQAVDGWETYSKDEFSIQYPKEWELNKAGQMGTEFGLFAPVESDDDKFRENINLVKQDISAYNLDLAAYANLSEKQILGMFTEAKILESTTKKAKGKSFYKMVYTAMQGIFRLKFVQYYWVENKKAYVLTFTSEEDKYDKFRSDGEKIMGSFKME